MSEGLRRIPIPGHALMALLTLAACAIEAPPRERVVLRALPHVECGTVTPHIALQCAAVPNAGVVDVHLDDPLVVAEDSEGATASLALPCDLDEGDPGRRVQGGLTAQCARDASSDASTLRETLSLEGRREVACAASGGSGANVKADWAFEIVLPPSDPEDRPFEVIIRSSTTGKGQGDIPSCQLAVGSAAARPIARGIGTLYLATHPPGSRLSVVLRCQPLAGVGCFGLDSSSEGPPRSSTTRVVLHVLARRR